MFEGKCTIRWTVQNIPTGNILLHHYPSRMSQKRSCSITGIHLWVVHAYCAGATVKQAQVSYSSDKWSQGILHETIGAGLEREGNGAGTGTLFIWATSSHNVLVPSKVCLGLIDLALYFNRLKFADVPYSRIWCIGFLTCSCVLVKNLGSVFYIFCSANLISILLRSAVFYYFFVWLLYPLLR